MEQEHKGKLKEATRILQGADAISILATHVIISHNSHPSAPDIKPATTPSMYSILPLQNDADRSKQSKLNSASASYSGSSNLHHRYQQHHCH